MRGGSEPTTLWTTNGVIGEAEVSGNLPNENNPNYPIGRYVWNGGESKWMYQGEPTGVISLNRLEVYSDNGTLKARAVASNLCGSWDDALLSTQIPRTSKF